LVGVTSKHIKQQRYHFLVFTIYTPLVLIYHTCFTVCHKLAQCFPTDKSLPVHGLIYAGPQILVIHTHTHRQSYNILYLKSNVQNVHHQTSTKFQIYFSSASVPQLHSLFSSTTYKFTYVSQMLIVIPLFSFTLDTAS
jgi:hypothetical protein